MFLATFSTSRHFVLSALLMLPAGFSLIMAIVSCNTLVQTLVDEDKRSRVMSSTSRRRSAGRRSGASSPDGRVAVRRAAHDRQLRSAPSRSSEAYCSRATPRRSRPSRRSTGKRDSWSERRHPLSRENAVRSRSRPMTPALREGTREVRRFRLPDRRDRERHAARRSGAGFSPPVGAVGGRDVDLRDDATTGARMHCAKRAGKARFLVGSASSRISEAFVDDVMSM
jgi:hypothetical protein